MARLDDIATAALKKHDNDPARALKDFNFAVKAAKLDLALEFLRQVAGRWSGQSAVEAHTSGAGPTPPAPKAGSIKVKEHDVRQHRRRTHEEKEADRAAMMASVEAVFEIQINGRALGSIAIGELVALKRDLIDDASHKLMLGTDQVRNAVLAELIEQHCTVQDQLIRVREAISASTLAGLVRRAEEEAPRRIAEGMVRAAEVMAHRNREIAV